MGSTTMANQCEPPVTEGRVYSTLDAFLDLVDRLPGRPALISYLAGHREPLVMTYGDMADRVDRLALKLLEYGVEPGQFVSYQLPNRWEFVIAHLATLRVGASSNPIMPIYGMREMRSMLERTSSRVCIGLKRNGQRPTLLTALKDEVATLQNIILIDDDDVDSSLDAQLATMSVGPVTQEQLDRLKPAPSDIDIVMFSSGTTGEPKGILHSHFSSHRAISNSFERMGMNGEDVILTFSPMGHATGFNNGVELPLFLGCRSVLQEIWNPEEMLRIVERERVTWTMGSSAFVKDVLDVAEGKTFDTSSLRCFACGGAPIPPQLIIRAKQLIGGELIPCWGMTEVGIATAGNLTDSVDRKSSSAGYPVNGICVRVVNVGGELVPPNIVGHLQIHADSQHVGFFGNEDLYRASFQDGWYRTGDLGSIDEEGYVTIAGRAKELVIRGGENIPIIEIENLLRDLPIIADLVIVGVPDLRLGERCHAVVVPSIEGGSIALKDLTDHLESLGVTKQFWPEFVSTIDVLPRTATGKIQRFLVRDQIIAGGDRHGI